MSGVQIQISTRSQRQAAAQLAALAAEIEQVGHALAAEGGRRSVLGPEVHLVVAAIETRKAMEAARVMAHLLPQSLLNYEGIEGALELIFNGTIDGHMFWTGVGLAGATSRVHWGVNAAGAAVLIGNAVALWHHLHAGGKESGPGRDSIADPESCLIIRNMVSAVDSFVEGLLLGLVNLDDADDVFGTNAGIRALLRLLQAWNVDQIVAHRTSEGTPVTVVDTGQLTGVQPPSDLVTLLDRVPPAHDGLAQLRIDNYEQHGRTHWVVYIGGTVTPVTDGNEPWDLFSCLEMLGESYAPSFAATMLALDAAGVGKGDPITFVGYSQGGIIGTRLAQDGGYNVQGVVTIGSPTGHLALPPGVPALAFQHADDPIPALEGLGILDNPNRTVVSRRAFGPDDGAQGIDAHSLNQYRITVQQYVADGAPGMPGGIGDWLNQNKSAKWNGTSTFYRGEITAARN